MISVENIKVGDEDIEHLVLLEDGFYVKDHKGTGYVQMDMRLYDGKGEGEGVAISIFDNWMEKEGDALPLTIFPEEIDTVINWLQKAKESFGMFQKGRVPTMKNPPEPPKKKDKDAYTEAINETIELLKPPK